MSDFTGAGFMFTLVVGVVLGLIAVSVWGGKYSTFMMLYYFGFLAVPILALTLVSNSFFGTTMALFYYLLITYFGYFVTVIWANALLNSKKRQGKYPKKR